MNYILKKQIKYSDKVMVDIWKKMNSFNIGVIFVH